MAAAVLVYGATRHARGPEIGTAAAAPASATIRARWRREDRRDHEHHK
ncbi:hypothetical protein [Streptomyces canus]